MIDDIKLETLEQYFEDAEDSTEEARAMSERCRDYYDNVQLTAEEKATLNKRNQPPVVLNLIAQNVDSILGLERQSRTDPKAYPRTPEHEEAANAVTDALRYVLDNNDFDIIASDVFENMIVEGTGAASVEVKKKPNGDIEIVIVRIPWDRFGVDPYSMRRDMKDARYTFVVAWKDLEDAQERWPEKAEELAAGMSMSVSHDSDTYDDKPVHWWDRKRKRVMCVDMYFLKGSVWHHAIFAKGIWLQAAERSRYLDDEGLPENPQIAFSAKVKRDGQRYGPVEALLDAQDEVNKRRSKSLHLLTTRQTFAKDGMIQDIDAFKKEANKPDGHLQFPLDGEFGKDFGTIPNETLVGPQFELYQDAKSFIGSIQANNPLVGDVQSDLSGKAIQSLQQAGMMELTPVFDAHAAWKKRIYRAVWNRIKQFWREEKWIRVTDDEDNLRFVGLNQPVTQGEQIVAEKMGISPTEARKQFAQDFQVLYQQQPQMMQQVATENDVAEMDVDIIVEEVPDVVNLQSEQFDLLVKMYQANPEGIPWEEVVSMSTLRNKDKILGKELEPEQQAQLEQQQQQQQEANELAKADAVAEIEGKQAKAAKDNADAQGKQIENALVALGAQ